MLNQTVDSLMPLLTILQQPAFCLRQDGSVLPNPPARSLSPYDRGDLPRWLGGSIAMYERWRREAVLTLPISLAGREYSVSIQALADGDLFLMTECAAPAAAGGTMSVSSQVLRAPLSELIASTQILLQALEDQENPLYQAQAASITRNLFRLTRLAGNLSDFERLQNGDLHPRLSLLSLSADLGPVLQDLSSLVAETGSSMEVRLPHQQIQFYADPTLLERALLNLISNALKHGSQQQTLLLQADVQPNAILFRLQSHCDDDEQDLLSTAFRRMEQRGLLPDPRWGMGIGLPLVRHIAQLHGGSVALEARQDGTVTVTMSVSRKRPPQETTLASPIRADLSGGLDRRLVELSEVLPASVFDMHLL